MPPSVSTTSPGLAPSTLPPRSTARSTSTEPGFIDFTMSAETSFGAGRPGISAVVMTMSCFLMCSAASAACLAFFFQAEDGIRGLYVTGVQTCALPISEDHCQGEPGDNVTRIVPHQVTTPQCFTGNGGASAGCRAKDYDDPMTPDAGTEIGNWRGGGYPPVYYGFMNLFIQDTLDESITVMRSVNAALVVLLVGGLAWLLPRRLRFLAPVTFVITAVPLALFMFTS